MYHEERLQTVGNRIKAERKKLRMTQADFLEAIFLSRSSVNTLRRWERGEKLPDIDSLSHMCELFRCDFGYLIGDYDTKNYEATDVANLTGLSEKAVLELNTLNLHYRDCIDALNTMIEFEHFRDILRSLIQCMDFQNRKPLFEQYLDTLENVPQILNLAFEREKEYIYSGVVYMPQFFISKLAIKLAGEEEKIKEQQPKNTMGFEAIQANIRR